MSRHKTRTMKRKKTIQERRARLHELNRIGKPIVIDVWDSREKRTIRSLRFVTKYEAQSFLDNNTYKTSTGYYRKDTNGQVDGEMEFTLKN
jgi:hypothetical protein